MKSLDQKLTNIHADPHGSRDFILADAKDADMGFGLAATGKDPVTGKPRSLADYRDQMRQIVKQGLVDIMLMSASTSEELTINERLFDASSVTPAVRANDTTDIYSPVGGTYTTTPSRPFRSVTRGRRWCSGRWWTVSLCARPTRWCARGPGSRRRSTSWPVT